MTELQMSSHCSTSETDYDEFFDQSIMSLDGVFISGAGDVVIPEKHFGLFQWDKLNISDTNTCTLSSGGYPLHNGQWTLCFWMINASGKIHPLARQYRWVIPESLNVLMRWCKENAEDDLKHKLRSLIGVS